LIADVERNVSKGALRERLRMAGSGGMTATATVGLTAAAKAMRLPDAVGAAGAGALIGALRSRRGTSPPSPSGPVWMRLTKHHKSVGDEVSDLRYAPPSDPVEALAKSVTGKAPEPTWWNIPAEPSMSVSISEGQILLDYMPTNASDADPQRNAPCPCGSGIKWKFCCMDVNFRLPPMAPPYV
jgi:hypothetical protein